MGKEGCGRNSLHLFRTSPSEPRVEELEKWKETLAEEEKREEMERAEQERKAREEDAGHWKECFHTGLGCHLVGLTTKTYRTQPTT